MHDLIVANLIFLDDLSRDRLKDLWKSCQEEEEEDGFDNEVFVKAASDFIGGQYCGLIDRLSESIKEGNIH